MVWNRIKRVSVSILLVLTFLAFAWMPWSDSGDVYAAGTATVQASGQNAGQTAASSEIRFERILNARDLGGYKTGDGRTVKRGVLIRSGELAYASAADLKALSDTYNLGYVVDFRYVTDAKYCKDKTVAGAVYRNIPAKSKARPSKSAPKKRFKALRSKSSPALPAGAAKYYSKVSRSYTTSLVTSSYSKKKYRQFFNLLLENKDGKGVLFHCVCGKDRTGVAAFMTLVALGVDEETAYKEYSMTNTYLRENAGKAYRKGKTGVRESDLRYAVRKAKKMVSSGIVSERESVSNRLTQASSS